MAKHIRPEDLCFFELNNLEVIFFRFTQTDADKSEFYIKAFSFFADIPASDFFALGIQDLFCCFQQTIRYLIILHGRKHAVDQACTVFADS